MGYHPFSGNPGGNRGLPGNIFFNLGLDKLDLIRYIYYRNKRGNMSNQVEDPTCGLTITSVSFTPVHSSMYRKAFATVVINGSLTLRGLSVMDGMNGLFVAYPLDNYNHGEDYRCAIEPTNDQLRTYINDVVISKYNESIKR